MRPFVPCLMIMAVAPLIPLTHISAIPKPATLPSSSLESEIRSDLESLKSAELSPELLIKWRAWPKDRVVTALYQEAKIPNLSPEKRFLATSALGQVGGKSSEQKLTSLLKNPQWLVRLSALSALEKISGHKELKGLSLALAQSDPSLMIRSQALRVYARKLAVMGRHMTRPEANAILQIAYSSKQYRPGNYDKGVPDELVFRSLEVLRHGKLQDSDRKEITSLIKPLMNRAHSRKLRVHALFTIETLQGVKRDSYSPKERLVLANKSDVNLKAQAQSLESQPAARLIRPEEQLPTPLF